MTVEDHQVSINRWTARAVPVFILGASGYVIYVVVQKICGQSRHTKDALSFMEAKKLTTISQLNIS